MTTRIWSAFILILVTLALTMASCRNREITSDTSDAVFAQGPFYPSYFQCAHSTKLKWANRDTPSYEQKWMVYADENDKEFGYLKKNERGSIYYILTKGKAYFFREAQLNISNRSNGTYRVKVSIPDFSGKKIATVSFALEKDNGGDINAFLPFEPNEVGFSTGQQNALQEMARKSQPIIIYANEVTDHAEFIDLYKDLRDGFNELDNALKDALKGLSSWQKNGGSLTGMLAMLQDNLNLNVETAKQLDGFLDGIDQPYCAEFYGLDRLKVMRRNRADLGTALNTKDFKFKVIERT